MVDQQRVSTWYCKFPIRENSASRFSKPKGQPQRAAETMDSAEEDGYDTPTSTSASPGHHKRRRIISFCDTPLSQAETPMDMDDLSIENTPTASPGTARALEDLGSFPTFSLDDSDDGYTTPDEDGDKRIRRPVYNQCATTGFAPPEKCFAPWRPRRPLTNHAGHLAQVFGLAGESTTSDVASVHATDYT